MDSADGEDGEGTRGGRGGEGAQGVGDGGSGGDDVVDDGDMESVEFFGKAYADDAVDVGAPLLGAAVCLCAVGTCGAKVVADGYARDVADAEGYLLALVVASAHEFGPVHGHGQKYVDVGEGRDAVGLHFRCEEASGFAREARHVAVLGVAHDGCVGRFAPVFHPRGGKREAQSGAGQACDDAVVGIAVHAGAGKAHEAVHAQRAFASHEGTAADGAKPRQQRFGQGLDNVAHRTKVAIFYLTIKRKKFYDY